MTVTRTQPSAVRRMRYTHDVAFHQGIGEFLAAALPFVREGVAKGEPVLAVLASDHLSALSESLGGDSGMVELVDVGEVAPNPARVIPEWRRFVADAGDLPVRGVGEPVWSGRREVEVEEGLMNDALFDLAFEDRRPMAMLCLYDVSALPVDVVARAHRLHAPRGAEEEPGAAALRAGLEALGAPLSPPPAGAHVGEFEADDLTRVRQRVLRIAQMSGAGRAAEDLMLAVHELATNSVVHGGGRGLLRSWVEPDALVVEVCDSGVIEDPLVGRDVLEDLAESGRGVWLANQLCDLVQVRSGESGTVVRTFTWL